MDHVLLNERDHIIIMIMIVYSWVQPDWTPSIRAHL